MVRSSPEWVTGPEQVKSSGRDATFNFWNGLFRDGNFSIPDEIAVTRLAVYIYCIYTSLTYSKSYCEFG